MLRTLLCLFVVLAIVALASNAYATDSPAKITTCPAVGPCDVAPAQACNGVGHCHRRPVARAAGAVVRGVGRGVAAVGRGVWRITHPFAGRRCRG